MEENKYDYEPEYGYDYENEENDSAKKSLRGYRIVIILLVVILGGVSALYFYASHNMQKDYELLDSSDGERLERWGRYILRRPDPQIIWKNPSFCFVLLKRVCYNAKKGGVLFG